MNPIPLSAPSGDVYVYACGRCHHAFASGSRLIVLTGPDDDLREYSRLDAERCCLCTRCGSPLDDDRRIGNCTTCERWTWFSFMLPQVATCIVQRFTTIADWDRYVLDTFKED